MSHLKEISDLQQIIRQLEASEEKFRDLFENSIVAMFTTDLTSDTTIDVNETGVTMFGYQSKKDFLENFKPIDHFINPELRQENYKTAEKEGEVRSREQEMKKLDGTHLWVRIFIKINHDKTSAQSVVIDITEQKKLEKEVMKYIQSLEDMLFMVSHEMRQPITSILTVHHLLKMEREVGKEELEMIINGIHKNLVDLDKRTRELTEYLYELGQKRGI